MLALCLSPQLYSSSCAARLGREASTWRESTLKKSKVAVFSTGEANALIARETELRAQGFHAIILHEPNTEDLALLKIEDGFLYGPTGVTWHQPAIPVADRLLTRGDLSHKEIEKKKSDYNRKVNASKNYKVGDRGIVVETGGLEDAAYGEWYRTLYLPFVAEGRDSGVDVAGAMFTRPEGASKGDLQRFSKLFLRDESTGNLIGGLILEAFVAEGVLKIRFAAFNREEKYLKLNLSYRSYDEALNLAIREQFETLSYGSCPNIYSNDLALMGIQHFKSSLGFQPLMWNMAGFDKTRIVKFLSAGPMGNNILTYSFASPLDLTRLIIDLYGDRPSNYSTPANISIRQHELPR